MNSLIKLLRISGARVSMGNRWLVWCNEWQVYERKPYQKKTRQIIITDDLNEAIRKLEEE